MDNPEQLGEGAVQGGNTAGTVSSHRKQKIMVCGELVIERMLLPLNIVERGMYVFPMSCFRLEEALVSEEFSVRKTKFK